MTPPAGISWLTAAQGAYYVVTGLWPVVHLPSFATVAGPKPDAFQTRVTGALFAVIGASLLTASTAPGRGRDARLMGLVTAISAATVTAAHLGRVRWTLRAEAVAEAGTAALLARELVRSRE